MVDGKEKVIFQGTSVTVAIFLSFKLALACALTENSGDVFGAVEVTLRNYLYLTLALFISTLVFYWLRKQKGVLIVIVNFLCLIVQPGWFSKQNAGFAGDCDKSIVNQALILFIISAVCFAYHFAVWLIYYKRSLNAKLP